MDRPEVIVIEDSDGEESQISSAMASSAASQFRSLQAMADAENELSSNPEIDGLLKFVIGSSDLESKFVSGQKLLDLFGCPQSGRSLSVKGRSVLSRSTKWKQVLLGILPKRSSLKLCDTVWGTNSFLKALEVNTTIESLHLYLPLNGKGKIKELCQALNKNSFLKSLTLKSTSHSITSNRYENQQAESSELSTLILCLGASKLNLNSHEFSGSQLKYRSTLQVSKNKESHTRRNTLKGLFLDHEQLLNFLYGTHFHVLELRLPPFPDATNTINATNTIIPYLKGATAGSLEILRLQNIPVDIPTLLVVLKTNKTLQSLHLDYTTTSPLYRQMKEQIIQATTPSVLQLLQEESNMTLTTFSPFMEECPKIHHLLNMNRFGRVAVRNGDVMILIGCLVRVQEVGIVENINHDGHAMIQSLLFGLLRERPELWSKDAVDEPSKGSIVAVGDPSKKRKRQQQGDGIGHCGKKRAS